MKKSSAAVHLVEVDDGWTARIGKSDVDNDLLTFQESFPQDWWLHAKGCPGSHVVLHHATESSPSDDILKQAARLALKYSKANPKGKGTVTLAKISDLKKARGGPAGQVVLRKSKTLTVYQT